MLTFADRLKKVRNGRNTKEFAAFVGIAAGTLSRYENGISSPSLRRAAQISEKTGVSLEWLLHGKGQEEATGNANDGLTTEGKENLVNVRYLEMLLETKEERLELYEKLVLALERENKLLLNENSTLQARIKELNDQLSLSAVGKRENPQGNTA
jgi:transcriptional regulator with XRE-family HTH domain